MGVTKKLIAFIVDDTPSALETLANDLRNEPEFESVHTFSTYADATLPLLELQPDVLFLDVEVPGKTGLEFLSSIRPKVNFTFKVVFYSAFSDYMIDAIRQSAFDFLLKPYKHSELRTIIDRLQQTPISEPVRPIASSSMPHKVAMQTVNELLLVSVDEMLLFTYVGESRSWQITMSDGNVHQLKRSVVAEDILTLNPSLVRISNTCIININYLAAVENNSQRCRFYPPFDHIDITFSRRYFGKLKERFDML